MAFRAPLPLNMLDAMRKSGIDLAALATRAGLAAEQLRQPLTPEQSDRFFVVAYEQVGNPAVGLALGMRMEPELFSVVGFAAMSSPTFGVALSRIARYNALVSACELELAVSGSQTEVRMRFDGPARSYDRCRLDIQTGSLLCFGRRFTERQIVPVRVTLRGEPPGYAPLYAQTFGCQVLFGQAHDAIVFGNDDLALPLVSANPSMASIFIEAAERGLADHARGGPGIAQGVREALLKLLGGELPTIAQVAGELCISERTLQRRLSQEGVKFSTLLDEARLQLASRYLDAGRASLTEIAYMLGFADPNSFFRSFKRWTGVTPDVYRHGKRGGAAATPP
ncbi:MAG: AraC family transcriptional regulator [Proteobacteria bacterium]|nr:AraC family transcriptional regulator [Pseudomonadota bacterium]